MKTGMTHKTQGPSQTLFNCQRTKNHLYENYREAVSFNVNTHVLVHIYLLYKLEFLGSNLYLTPSLFAKS
ncbi:MAG: hypothetical protein KAV87_32185, partial [Desulfobacteraceae bacterium]|nr:hypothetical protein [Desulfobacteraceae bacterium]